MMLFVILLIIIEVVTLIVLKEHFSRNSKVLYHIIITFHILLSIWLWILIIGINTYTGYADTSFNIWSRMNLNGMITAVVFPRIVVIVFHFTGKFLKRKNGGYYRSLTNTGTAIAIVIFSLFAHGTLAGRFNFKTEEIKIRIRNLNPSLDGLRIVQLSDVHLSGFHHHKSLLKEVMKKIAGYNPDFIINTGDFVTCGWREFEGFDTILASAKGRYGNFAVFGNHDSGSYLPVRTDSALIANTLRMNEMMYSSGYYILNDEHTIVNVNGAMVAMIGVTTGGTHPDIIHGDLEKAMYGLDSADLRIFLCHDPNQWEEDVTGKTDIELTLAGHTHGMQLGILTRKVRWSPSQYFYPHWNGLYSKGDQQLYVNRGLGVLAIPVRIWMPPEISVIELQAE